MLKIYAGTVNNIKPKLKELATKHKLTQIKFTKNILSEKLYGLFYTPSVYYFLYNKELFSDKDSIKRFVDYCNNTNSLIVCIIEETIDKKSSFYKQLKNEIIEVGSGNKTIDHKEEILRDLSYVYKVDNSKFISVLFALSYTRYGQASNFVLNLILTGRLNNVDIAKKLLVAILTNK